MLRFLKLCAVAALLISILGSTSGAYAGDECYSPYEAEAEQGIRIHSELMVIGLILIPTRLCCRQFIEVHAPFHAINPPR